MATLDNLRMLPWIRALALACGFSSCALFGKPYGVTLATDPPGARVLVDQKDSGFVTPCRLALEPDESYRVDFTYPGYQTATRLLESDRDWEARLWDEMYMTSRVWKFPLWLNLGDVFTPIQTRRILMPSRVYVRLERAADQ
jgi:hypothetical protein